MVKYKKCYETSQNGLYWVVMVRVIDWLGWGVRTSHRANMKQVGKVGVWSMVGDLIPFGGWVNIDIGV